MPCYRHPRPAIAVGPIDHILKGSTTQRERSSGYRMIEKRPYLRELDEAISRGTHATRLQALWHATDLLIAGRYSDDQIWVFGEVIGRLAGEIEHTSRVQLAKRLAFIDQAPTKILHELAFDDSIEIAGPILQQSQSLTTDALVENARSKSQQHLLAISNRESVPSEVTDILVVRGDGGVVNAVTKNSGAAFSDPGFLHLVRRSENDSILGVNLGSRTDIPRHIFQQLIAKASDEVKQKLQSEHPGLKTANTSHRHGCCGQTSLEIWPGVKGLLCCQEISRKNPSVRRTERNQACRIRRVSKSGRSGGRSILAVWASSECDRTSVV